MTPPTNNQKWLLVDEIADILAEDGESVRAIAATGFKGVFEMTPEEFWEEWKFYMGDESHKIA